MSKTTYSNEEVKVGLIVLGAGAVLIVLVAAVLGLRPGADAGYRAWFADVAGLKKGSPVQYGGHQVGRVAEVVVSEEARGRLEVRMAVDGDLRVPRGTIATIDTPLFGETGLALEPGDPDDGFHEVGDLLPSREPFDMSQTLTQVQDLVEEVGSTMERLAGDIQAAAERAERVLASVEDVVGEDNRGRIESLLAQADELVSESRPPVERSLERVDRITASLEETSGSARRAVADVEELLERNREDLDALVRDTHTAVQTMERAVSTMEELLSGQRGNLEETLASMRETSRNLEELTRRLKERPWSLVRRTRPREDVRVGDDDYRTAPPREGIERSR